MIYLCGPISHRNQEAREYFRDTAALVYRFLVEQDRVVFCPHLSAYVPGAFDVPYEKWIALDTYFTSLTSSVFLLPGWHRSKGGYNEVALLMRRSLPMFQRLTELGTSDTFCHAQSWLESRIVKTQHYQDIAVD